VGDKLVVYFTGVHTDLRRQTREGMAKVIMERMMYGENFREVVKNALLLNLPKWVLYGYTSYLIEGWDAKTHTDWKNLLAANPKSSFYDLSADHYEIAGKAFWKYISDRYGDNNMKTLLFNMQTKGNYNQSVKQTLGQTPRLVSDSILGYFNRMYEKDELQREAPDTTKTKLVVDLPTDGSIIQSFKVAPKGNDVAYVSWKNGEYKVYMQSTLGPQARYAILEEGKPDYAAQPDPNYPLLAWSNSGYKLAVLYRKNNKNMLRVYNSLKARVENYVIPNNRFDRALGMTFNEDDDRLVFSAIKKSQTDLYEFVIRGARMNNITNDEWDDIQPWFVSGGSKRGILFLSNRPKGNLNVPVGVNELPTGPMNVFFYNTKTKRKELLQMSNVKEGNISQPIQYGSEHFAYLYDINGVQNQYIVTLKRDKNNMETPVATAVTNYSRNIISHQYNPASRQAADVMQVGNQYIVYYRPLQYPGVNVEAKNPERTTLLQSERDRVKITRKPGESLLKGGDVFQSEFKDDGSEATTQATPDGIAVPAGEADSTYLKMRAQPYRTSFKLDFFTIKLDNSLLFNRYQPAELNGGVFQSPPIGGMLTASLNDLMENHRLTGGVRLPLNFTGLTYFLQYENFKRRLDWGLLYLRSVTYKNELIGINIPPNPTIYSEQMLKTTMNIVQATANYPLDHIRSIRLQGSFRSDKLVLKSQDIIGLTAVPVDGTQNWGILRAEYVFDNTKKPIINIYNGFRYKFFGEYYARVNGPGGGMFSVGTDFRYYAKIYRNFIWAVRAAAATSDGKYKILYHVGGVDNWFANRKYSDYVPVRPYENYGLETIVTSLRGYELNSRNGNSYTVLNSEFRLPLVTTFIKRPIQSSILKNLQAVAFVDAGAAWEGIWPNADRLKNDRILPDPNGGQASNVTLIISDETAGLGVGYGAGLRTMLFGYFFRVDAAWNIDGRTKPLWHLGVGTDF
jgi:hypothetical protein